MKKMQSIVLALSLVLVAPMAAQAAEITLVPSVKLQIGDRDNRGYYWDGYDYRDPSYWKQHNGPRGEKHYTGHGKQGRHKGEGVRHHDDEHRGHCPPGQAKKGNC